MSALIFLYSVYRNKTGGINTRSVMMGMSGFGYEIFFGNGHHEKYFSIRAFSKTFFYV
jgi:hypothetical protein